MQILILVFIVLLSGCATADHAQLFDAATTSVAMEAGFSEANPVFGGASWPVIAAVKLGVTQVAKLTPEPFCSSSLFSLTVAGVGAAFWNIGVMLGSGLAALPVAGAIIWWSWDDWQLDAVSDCATAQEFMQMGDK